MHRHFRRLLGCSFFFFFLVFLHFTCHLSPTHYTGQQQQRCHQGSSHLTAREESSAIPIPRDRGMRSFDFVALRQAGMKAMCTVSKPLRCWLPPAVCQVPFPPTKVTKVSVSRIGRRLSSPPSEYSGLGSCELFPPAPESTRPEPGAVDALQEPVTEHRVPNQQ